MSSQLTEPAASAERVNELYWNSGLTVDQITEEMGIGRNTLYSSLRPSAAGEPCPACGTDLVYTSRTSRASGTAVCENCGLTRRIGEVSNEGVIGEPPRPNGSGPTGRARSREASAVRVARIGGAVVLGALLGTAAGRVVRK